MYSLYDILTIDAETKVVFPERPFVSFRSARNLKSYLVRAKLYPEEEKTPGSEKCGGPKCLTCNNIQTTDLFTSSDNKKTFKINHPLNCNSKNVIYLLTCKVCNMKYVGQTTTIFRIRWNNYKYSHRKASEGKSVEQSSFHNHFLDPNHQGLERTAPLHLLIKLMHTLHWKEKISG